MGWTHATIEGITIHELVCEVQADLIRGVNERRECVGLSPLYFYYGDGTVTKTYPTAADFDGFPLLGEDVGISEPLLDNLTAVQGFLTGTAPSYFVTTSTGDTFYTATTLATAVGLGAFPSLASGWNFRDATLWQRMQDALDLLVYVKRYIMYADIISVATYLREAESPGTEEQIWDRAKVDTPYYYSNSPVQYAGWREDWEGALVTELFGPTTWTVNCPVAGTASRVIARVRQEWMDMNLAVDFDVNGESVNNGTGDGATEEYVELTPDFDGSGNMEMIVDVTTSEPANVPWTLSASKGDGWFEEYGIGTLAGLIFAPNGTTGISYPASSVNIDLTSELTDQT